MSEVWKDIPGYEGLYQASDQGKIRSLDREVVSSIGRVRKFKGKILKFKYYKTGRPCVELYKNGKSKMYKPYYLILLTFVGERPEGYNVAHLDGNFLNNQLSNIRYDTGSENQIDFYRQGKKSNTGKLSIDEVLEIRRLYATGEYKQRELAEMYRITRANIGSITRKETFSWLNDDGTIQESNTAVS